MVRYFIVAATSAGGAVAFAIQIAVAKGLVPPANRGDVWQQEALKLTAFGACVTCFTVLYALAKQFYPHPKNSTQYLEFHLATSAHLALLRAMSIGCLVVVAAAGIWPMWIALPTLFIAVALTPLALLDAYRAWHEEKKYYRARSRVSHR